MAGQLLEFRGQTIFVPSGVPLPEVERSILDDLVGFRNGKDGRNGRDGLNGRDGKAGANGRDGINGATGKDGKDGRPGRHGLDGKDGRDGKDGVGIDQISQPTDDIALFELSNGKKIQIRLPRGKDGKDGRDSEGRTVVVNRFLENPSASQLGETDLPTKAFKKELSGRVVQISKSEHGFEDPLLVVLNSEGEEVSVAVKVTLGDLEISSLLPLDNHIAIIQ